MSVVDENLAAVARLKHVANIILAATKGEAIEWRFDGTSVWHHYDKNIHEFLPDLALDYYEWRIRPSQVKEAV